MPDERLDAIVPCVKKNPFAKLASLEAPSGKSNGKCHWAEFAEIRLSAPLIHVRLVLILLVLAQHDETAWNNMKPSEKKNETDALWIRQSELRVGTIWHPLKDLKTRKCETGDSKMPVNLCFCADQGNIFSISSAEPDDTPNAVELNAAGHRDTVDVKWYQIISNLHTKSIQKVAVNWASYFAHSNARWPLCVSLSIRSILEFSFAHLISVDYQIIAVFHRFSEMQFLCSSSGSILAKAHGRTLQWADPGQRQQCWAPNVGEVGFIRCVT